MWLKRDKLMLLYNVISYAPGPIPWISLDSLLMTDARGNLKDPYQGKLSFVAVKGVV